MKKAIAICINDAHIGKETISDFKDNWNEMLQYAKKYDVDYVLIGGDTFKSRVAQSLPVLLTVRKCFQDAYESGFTVFNAPGNHDKVDQENVESYCHVFGGMNGYNVVDEYEVIESGGVAIHMMPYFPESGSFKSRFDKLVKLKDGVKNILYIHEGINGALSNAIAGENKELPAEMFSAFDSVLVGHYHDRVHIEGTNVYYIGSSRQHNFGEDMDKGYTIIYDDGSFEFLENKVNTRYITFDEKFEDINKSTFSEIKTSQKEGYKVRVKIHCKSNQKKLINKIDFVNAGAAKVETIEERIEEKVLVTASSVRFNKEGLKMSYSDFCEEKGDIEPEFGLKYIDTINI